MCVQPLHTSLWHDGAETEEQDLLHLAETQMCMLRRGWIGGLPMPSRLVAWALGVPHLCYCVGIHSSRGSILHYVHNYRLAYRKAKCIYAETVA